jgi:hypothetical protein
MEKGHSYFVGDVTGTFFNDKGKGSLFDRAGVKCPVFIDTDTNNKKQKSGGYCIISDADGDQAYLTFERESDFPPSPEAHPGTFEYTGGTGKYKGITGKNTFVPFAPVNWPDGTASGYSIWNR